MQARQLSSTVHVVGQRDRAMSLVSKLSFLFRFCAPLFLSKHMAGEAGACAALFAGGQILCSFSFVQGSRRWAFAAVSLAQASCNFSDTAECM